MDQKMDFWQAINAYIDALFSYLINDTKMYFYRNVLPRLIIYWKAINFASSQYTNNEKIRLFSFLG